MILDCGVHERLGETGFVTFVMAVAAVTVHVDDDIATELLAEFEGELDRGHGGDGIVSVHVENRCAHHLSHGGAILAGGTILRRSREADLVIDDDMDRAAGLVTFELGKIERLRDHTLTAEGGITVDEHGEHLLAFLGIVQLPLPGAGLAFDHGVNRFEMARIRREAEADLRPGAGGDDRIETEVILHIAIAQLGAGDVVFREFVEDELVVLAEDIGEDVQAAAVGHAHDDLLHAEAGAFFQNFVEDRDDRLTAFEREALLADIARVDELLEQLAGEEAG